MIFKWEYDEYINDFIKKMITENDKRLLIVTFIPGDSKGGPHLFLFCSLLIVMTINLL